MSLRTHLPLLMAAICIASVTVGPARAASKEEMVRQHVAALRAQPDNAEARENLRRCFTDEYPLRLPADTTVHLSIPHKLCADTITPAAPAQQAFYTTGLAFPDAAHRQDPASGEAFNRVLYAYVRETGGGGEWVLRFRILYNRADPGAEELAPRVGRLLLRVSAAYGAFLGEKSRALSRPVDVWLRGNGDGGAEQTGTNLYLHGMARKREPVELLRQLAHEFGHLTLPAIGPLKEPETWGNGFLGEMLILRWLSRAPAATEELVPREALDAYVRQEVEPLARAFAAAGWGSLSGNETSTGGLRLLLGMVLHREDTRGTASVATLLSRVQGSFTIRDWIAASRDE